MTSALPLLLDRVDTPIGEMIIIVDHDGYLRATDWTDHESRLRGLLHRYYGPREIRLEPSRNPGGLSDAVRRYFAGETGAIDALPVQTAGTPFQRDVWRALREIPNGTTVSYAQLAGRIGRPAAVRAVGHANGANPVGVVVPCHRVIGSDGSLRGYGSGLERKRWLLAHERRYATIGTSHPPAVPARR
jgi:methylated-DNA-[protein]-cysteine S-methyltransferase